MLEINDEQEFQNFHMFGTEIQMLQIEYFPVPYVSCNNLFHTEYIKVVCVFVYLYF